MSLNDKTRWYEGLHLRPHHFQQYDRYIENLIHARSSVLTPYGWGFTALSWNESRLKEGKFTLERAQGVLPDGTPFNVPDDDAAPLPLEVPEGCRRKMIFLGARERAVDVVEAEGDAAADSSARYFKARVDVQNVNPRDSDAEATAKKVGVDVSRLRLRLLLEGAELAPFAHMGVVRVREREGREVLLDEAYAPPCLDYRVSQYLSDLVVELRDLIKARGDQLERTIGQPGAGGIAEVIHYLFLQVLNAGEPLLIHLSKMRGLHPEALYRALLPIAGELATFGRSDGGRRPSLLPDYRHDDLWGTFTSLAEELRRSLTDIPPTRAVPVRIEEKVAGYRWAPVANEALFGQAMFVLGVRAGLSPDDLRRQVPRLIKVGPYERIQSMVEAGLHSLEARAMAHVPREIPVHDGFVYFELDRSNPYWKELGKSKGIALHVAGDFPDLQLELWAVSP